MKRGGLVRFDNYPREIEHRLALIFRHDNLKEKARPVIVRIQRGAEGVKRFVVFHLVFNKLLGGSFGCLTA